MKHCMGRWALSLTRPETCRRGRHSGRTRVSTLHGLFGRKTLAIMAGFTLLSMSAGLHAATLGFTNSTAFQSALPGPATIVNFDNVNAGTSIPDGTPFQGISFASNVDNVPGRSGLSVSAQFLTTSPLNYLGVDDGFSNEFLFGDELTLNFSAPVQAVGLSIIAGPEATLTNDFLLTAGGGSVFNVGTPEQILFDGGEVFFLGLISDQTFNTAQLISFGDQLDTSLGFNIDDVASISPTNPAAVPEPASVVLLGTGLLLFGGMKHWGRLKHTSVKEAA